MLQIYIHGNLESGFLDLIPGTVLDVEALQESFDEDITSGEFTLPIDVEWTDNNRRLFNFSERVENFKRAENFFICTVYYQHFPELVRAKFTILGKQGNFNYRKGKFTASISGSKGLYGSAIRNKKMTDLSLGGIIEWAGMDSREFAYSHATGGQPQYPYISFAPVAIEQFFQEDRRDFLGEFLAKDTVNTVVITGVGTNDWTFGRPSTTDPSTPVPSGTDGYQDYRTVPFFKTQNVFSKCFTEFGFTVSGDLLEDPEFLDLCMFNNYGIEILSRTFIDFNRRIIPSNHMPDVLISDWLKAMFSLTSMFPVFEDNNKVRLVYHKTDIVVNKIVSLDDEIDGEFESETLDGTATENGYKVAFAWDSADQYYSERVKDRKDKTLVATVAVYGDLATLDIGRPMNTDDIVLVQSENIFYQVADATTTPILYDAWSENLDEYLKGEGEKTIDISMSTLCHYVELDPATQLYVRKNYVGCRQPGSYINNSGALVKNSFGLRVFYISQEMVGTVIVPVSYNHNRNALNQRRCRYSLSINGTDGLAEAFHIPWLNIIENAELIKVSARSSPKVLQTLRTYNRFQIAGTLFFLKKIERSIPPGPTIKLEVVAL
ncbi:MAG: hypothetical protein V4594_16750 [Bacteroidota bacterium]